MGHGSLAVEHSAVVRTARARPDEHEAVVGREAECDSGRLTQQQLAFAGRDVDDHAFVPASGGCRADRHQQLVAVLPPRTQDGVGRIARHHPGRGPVGAHHGHFAPYPPTDGRAVGEPLTVGGPGDGEHRIGSRTDSEGRGTACPVRQPERRNSAALGYVGYRRAIRRERRRPCLQRSAQMTGESFHPGPCSLLPLSGRHPTLCDCNHISRSASCHRALDPSVVRSRLGDWSIRSMGPDLKRPRRLASGDSNA